MPAGRPVREGAYSGGPRMAAEFPSGKPSGAPRARPAAAGPEPSPADAPGEGKAPAPAKKSAPAAKGSVFGDDAKAVDDVGGFVLALWAWAWLVLPLLQGGPSRVGAVLRAKCLNRGAGGEWLP